MKLINHLFVLLISTLGINNIFSQNLYQPVVTDSNFVSTFVWSEEEVQRYRAVTLTSDKNDNIVVAGTSNSLLLPTTEGTITSSNRGGNDIFIAVFNSDLNELKYSAILGGSGNDSENDVQVDSNGDIYLLGTTSSADFLENPLWLSPELENAQHFTFLIKLSADLTGILSSCILTADTVQSTVPTKMYIDDKRKQIIIGGITSSGSFPATENAFQGQVAGNNDKYVMVISQDLKNIKASTLLGGKEREGAVNGIAVDKSGNIFIGGSTFSKDYPVTDEAYQPEFKGGQVYGHITKLNGDLSKVLASTFIGETGNDFVYGITLGNDDNIIFTGHVNNAMPKTEGAYKTQHSGHPDIGNLGIMSNDLSELLSHTIVVGGGQGSWWGGFTYFGPVVQAVNGDIYVMGKSEVKYCPTTPGVVDNTANGYKDILICRFNSDLSDLLSCTIIGGSGDENSGGFALLSNNRLVVSGATTSEDFPVTKKAYKRNFENNQNIFLARFNPDFAGNKLFQLHYACSKGDLEQVKNIVVQYPDMVHNLDDYSRTPLHWAARFGKNNIIEYLIKNGANVNCKDENANTPLHLASLHDFFNTAMMLLNYNGYPNSRNEDGDTPLHLAAHIGSDKIVSALIQKGANVDSQNSVGNAPLHRAVYSKQLNTSKVLISAGSDINIQNNSGETPLHLASVVFRSEELVKLLLENSAELNLCSNSNETAIHYAAYYSWEPSLELLLDYKPDLNIVADDGKTALHYAVENHMVESVKKMLSLGVNTTVKDNEGKAALDIAKEKGFEELVNLLSD